MIERVDEQQLDREALSGRELEVLREAQVDRPEAPAVVITNETGQEVARLTLGWSLAPSPQIIR